MDILETQKKCASLCTYEKCGKPGHWEKDCYIKDPSKDPRNNGKRSNPKGKGSSSGKPNPKGKGNSLDSNKEVDICNESEVLLDSIMLLDHRYASVMKEAAKAVAMMASKLGKTNL